MRTTTALAVTLAFAIINPPAQAHFLRHPKNMALTEKVAYFQRSVNHDRTQVRRDQRLLRRLVQVRYLEIAGAQPLYRLISYRARWHRQAFRWHRELLARYTAKAQKVRSYSSGWYRVASCESGQNWSYNGDSGFDGGLQFLPSTWIANGGTRYAPYAYMATAEQQIAVASSMSLSNWPICGSRF